MLVPLKTSMILLASVVQPIVGSPSTKRLTWLASSG